MVLYLFDPLKTFLSKGIHDWGSLHPLVVHFPIALLFVVPLFIILGLIFQRSFKNFYGCALILMLLGTASIFLATSTGDSASDAVAPNPDVVATLETHVKFAEQARLLFSILTAVFLIYLGLLSKLPKSSALHLTLGLIFLGLYTFNLIFLFNAAHYGGRLIHHHNLKSPLYSD